MILVGMDDGGEEVKPGPSQRSGELQKKAAAIYGLLAFDGSVESPWEGRFGGWV